MALTIGLIYHGCPGPIDFRAFKLTRAKVSSAHQALTKWKPMVSFFSSHCCKAMFLLWRGGQCSWAKFCQVCSFTSVDDRVVYKLANSEEWKGPLGLVSPWTRIPPLFLLGQKRSSLELLKVRSVIPRARDPILPTFFGIDYRLRSSANWSKVPVANLGTSGFKDWLCLYDLLHPHLIIIWKDLNSFINHFMNTVDIRELLFLCVSLFLNGVFTRSRTNGTFLGIPEWAWMNI